MTYSTLDLDVEDLRRSFPSLRSDHAHFDAPGGTQTPEAVARAVYTALTGPLSNRGRNTQAERNADDIVHDCRAAMADLLGVDPGTVVFGRSATALTFEMSRTLSRTWAPGDEIIVTRLDHDANVRPWVLAGGERGVRIRWVDFDPATGELDLPSLTAQLSERTRVVAVTAASNLIGTMPDLTAIADVVHRAGALLYVDGVHYAAHSFVDVPALGVDLFVCSPYKFLGPHCGVLTGRGELLERLRPDKLVPSSDQVPERFELGTLPYELMAGTTAAVDFLADLVPGTGPRRDRLRRSLDAVHRHENRLRARIEEGLAAVPDVTVYSRAGRRTPTLLFTLGDVDSREVSAALAARGVNAPAGSFYAYEAARRLQLPPGGGLRVGLAPYNDDDDVDRLLAALNGYARADRRR
jgi:cysteine desulfurase family protein (TIGR01976 family)